MADEAAQSEICLSCSVPGIPVFTLLVGVLFLMTGFGEKLKLILAPLPMLAVLH